MISCRKEREANATLGRPRFSKLLASNEGANNDENNEDNEESPPNSTELSLPVRELCKTIDAFIYVVDSSADSQRGKTRLLLFLHKYRCK